MLFDLFFAVAAAVLGTMTSAARLDAQLLEVKVEKDITYGTHVRQKFDLSILANPITHLDKADPPVLILHGDKDTAVPLSQSELFCKALEAVEVEHQLIVVAGAGHDSKVLNEETTKQLTEFFDKHLKKR